MREKRHFNFAWRWVQSDPVTSGAVKLQRHMTLALSGGLILFLLMSTPWIWSYKLQYDIKTVNGQIAEMTEVNALWQKLTKAKNQLDAQKKVLKLAQDQTNDPHPLLQELSLLMPPGTKINQFSLQGEKVTLQVNTPLPIDVARLWVSMRDSQLFKSVDIQTVSLNDKSQTMNLNLQLNKPLRTNPASGITAPTVGSEP